ncbi:hypothetical protein EVAR_7631_1 [Eumeta japonica]|uniref:PWI domain-containing protein n=1 Tax=Eumeta variegata TaxID=151549 RepID=A0A4C1TLL0_EUMVA|nr:hypothetical protein EVAR_7631_1 [Eumeta japonica]
MYQLCLPTHESDLRVIRNNIWTGRLGKLLLFLDSSPCGTSTEQDTRFSDKEKKLMKQMKFGDCLTQQVDMSKVKLDVLKPWITQKITEILKMEDDVVIDYVNNQLEEKVAKN